MRTFFFATCLNQPEPYSIAVINGSFNFDYLPQLKRAKQCDDRWRHSTLSKLINIDYRGGKGILFGSETTFDETLQHKIVQLKVRLRKDTGKKQTRLIGYCTKEPDGTKDIYFGRENPNDNKKCSIEQMPTSSRSNAVEIS